MMRAADEKLGIKELGPIQKEIANFELTTASCMEVSLAWSEIDNYSVAEKIR